MTNRLTAACLCGAVQLHVDDADSGGVKWCANCHCSMCRRAHGAGVVAWVGVKRAAFHIDRGAEVLARYRSSPPAQRSFCSKCGSPLLFESERWPDEIHIALAAVVEPHGLKPTVHAFFDDRAAWVHVDDGLPRRGGVTGTTPL